MAIRYPNIPIIIRNKVTQIDHNKIPQVFILAGVKTKPYIGPLSK